MESERGLEGFPEKVETCSNLCASVPFLSWRGGRLFRYNVKAPSEPCLCPGSDLPAEADPEISAFLDVRERLREPDSLRFARRACS